jgi:hypothetical protein
MRVGLKGPTPFQWGTHAVYKPTIAFEGQILLLKSMSCVLKGLQVLKGVDLAFKGVNVLLKGHALFLNGPTLAASCIPDISSIQLEVWLLHSQSYPAVQACSELHCEL